MPDNCVVIEPSALVDIRSKRVRHDSYHRINSDEIYQSFFQTHTCYDCMPKSGKVLLLDARLTIRKAFFALVFNNVRAALVWDAVESKMIGLITISDFVNMLVSAYDAKWKTIDTLEMSTILQWKKEAQEHLGNSVDPLGSCILKIGPTESLCSAISMLITHKIHRLPVVDPQTNDFLFLITHKRMLKFLYLYIYDLPQPNFIHQTLDDLKLGTYGELTTINLQTKLIDVLRIFQKVRLSALPVIDNENRVCDVYSKFDITHLAATRTYANLDVPLSEILDSIHNQKTYKLATCKLTDQLFELMDKFVTREVHRLMIVNDEKNLLGVLSISDLMKFLVTNIESSTRTSFTAFTSTLNTPVFEDDGME